MKTYVSDFTPCIFQVNYPDLKIQMKNYRDLKCLCKDVSFELPSHLKFGSTYRPPPTGLKFRIRTVRQKMFPFQ